MREFVDCALALAGATVMHLSVWILTPDEVLHRRNSISIGKRILALVASLIALMLASVLSLLLNLKESNDRSKRPGHIAVLWKVVPTWCIPSRLRLFSRGRVFGKVINIPMCVVHIEN